MEKDDIITITKADLANHLCTKLNINKLVSREIVDDLFEEIRKSLEQARSVKISRFGNWELRDKKPRPGRNPKTGEPKVISARRVVNFKPGTKLKERVQARE